MLWVWLICRHKLSEEYQKQVVSVFLQWESDMQKVKEAEEKLQVGGVVTAFG